MSALKNGVRVLCRAMLALVLAGTVAHADELPWQNMRLDSSGDWRLTMSGQLRQRAEYVRNPDFGFEATQDDVVMHRLLLGAKLDWTDRLSAFAQFGNWAATDRTTGNPPTDRNSLDLAQAYLDLRFPEVAKDARIRAGRQEVSFGSSRLVSVRDSPNVRRSFDGVRATLATANVTSDAVLLRPVEIHRNAFDDQTDTRELLAGTYFTFKNVHATNLDAYYLVLTRDNARFLSETAQETRHSLGARLFGSANLWDWDIEAVAQFGSFGGDQIRAWTIASDIGYTVKDWAWKPRFAIKADIASGDRDPNDHTLETFNALYPKVPYFSEASLVYPANVMDVQPNVTLHPSSNLEVNLSYNPLWRFSTSDFFYQPALVPLPGTRGSDARFLGQQLQISIGWEITPNIDFKGWITHFSTSAALQQAGADDVTFSAAALTFKF